MEKTYAERADSATTFDPELQFDRDIDRDIERELEKATDEEISVLRNKS